MSYDYESSKNYFFFSNKIPSGLIIDFKDFTNLPKSPFQHFSALDYLKPPKFSLEYSSSNELILKNLAPKY